MSLQLGFHGGAGTVTGSRHLLDTGRLRVQVDAGLFQGLKRLRELNWREPPYPASSVDHLLLTHAHIDHSGFLPRFVKNGFRGTVHCTKATRDLAAILLMDSARIQEQDARYANKKGWSRHQPALPLYETEDVERTLALALGGLDATQLHVPDEVNPLPVRLRLARADRSGREHLQAVTVKGRPGVAKVREIVRDRRIAFSLVEHVVDDVFGCRGE